MKRAAKIISGVTYDFSHLEPLIIPMKSKDGQQNFNVRISFGSHCFTTAWDANHNSELLVEEWADKRTFCPQRYVKSLHLPAIIRTAIEGKVYFSQREEFLIICRMPALPDPYCVFFDIKRSQSRADINLFVISAYEKRNLPPLSRLSAIRFSTLAERILKGQPIKRPKK